MVSCGQKWYLVKVLWTFDFLPTTQRAQETWRCLPERHKNQKRKSPSCAELEDKSLLQHASHP